MALRTGGRAEAARLVRRHVGARRRPRRASIHDRAREQDQALLHRDEPTLRGFLIIALIAAVVVVLSLEEVVATVGGLLRIAFFLAIAFFLFLLWRERRGDIESWGDRSRRVFYAAIILAVVDIGAFIGLQPEWARTPSRSSSSSAPARTRPSASGATSTATASRCYRPRTRAAAAPSSASSAARMSIAWPTKIGVSRSV